MDASATVAEQLPPETPQAPPALYDAFISYRHTGADLAWALWLHRALEGFRTPRSLVAKGIRKRLLRVFRDEDELHASSDLNEAVFEALHSSRFLIVICSPRAAESKWVNAEINEFQKIGRRDFILPLLIEGEPGQAFPPALQFMDATGLTEPLAADVRDAPKWFEWRSRRRALLKILAPILGCNFDDLLQRERERTKWRRTMFAAGLSVLAVAATGLGALYVQRQAFELASRSDDILARDPSLSLLLSRVAFEKSRWLLGMAGEIPRNSLERAIVQDRLRAQVGLHSDVEIKGLAWQKNGVIAAGGAYGGLVLWDRKSAPTEAKGIFRTGSRIDSLAFNPVGDATLAIGDNSPKVRIVNLKDGGIRELATGRDDDDKVSPGKLSWCIDGNQLAVTDGTKAVKIFDLTSDAAPTEVDADQTKSLNTVAWNPDCTALAIGGQSDSYLWLKGSSKAKKLGILGPKSVNAPIRRAGTLALAWHRKGFAFASGGQDGTVIVTTRSPFLCPSCDDTTSALLGSHDNPVVSLAWGGPLGSSLASAGLDGTVRIWAQQFFSEGYPKQTIMTNQKGSWSVAWSPDGKELASGGGDGTIKIWRISREPEQVTLGGHAALLIISEAQDALVSPRLLFEGRPLNNSELGELARQRSLRSFTAEECASQLQAKTCPDMR